MRARFVSLAIAAALAAAVSADADDGHPWDATWVGRFENDGEGVQVIIAGDSVIGFYFGADYVDVTESDPIAADGSLSFKWDGGEATFSGTGADRVLTLRARGAPARIVNVRQDH